MRFLNIFHRKRFKPEPKSLRIDGVSTKMTPKPDDAELAAQALLEHMSDGSSDKKHKRTKGKVEKPKDGTPEHYQQLSGKIKEAHAQEARDAQRYLAYTEQELKEHPSMEQLIEIERGLYQHQDAADREGGELKSRWQHCLAQCTMLHQDIIAERAIDSEGS
jgi:hypothetical protein